ncbi:MAG: hypothetical protein GY696_05385 [Gammaproteobacteria bacterium]|nr:hypothetical protein [Gammaproteobacteria bacterium]
MEPPQQLHAIANAMTEEQKKDYVFITKARDRLRQCVPKFWGPTCGQAGHFVRECPHSSAPNGHGRGRYQPRGGYSQY